VITQWSYYSTRKARPLFGFAPALFRGVGSDVEPLQITEIVGGWFIPGAAIGEAYAAGPAKNQNSVIAAQGFAAGAVVAEGRFR
jgi:hypothetical protein